MGDSSQRLYAKAQRFQHRRGGLGKARALYRQIVERFPDSPECGHATIQLEKIGACEAGAAEAPLARSRGRLVAEALRLGDTGDTCVVRLESSVDHTNTRRLEEFLNTLTADGRVRIVLDMKDVAFVGSPVWGMLAAYARGLRSRGGDLALACIPEQPAAAFSLLELGQVLPAFATVKEAAAGLGAGQRADRSVPAASRTHATSLEQEICAAIADCGPLSLIRLRRKLRTEQYGRMKTGLLGLYRALRHMNLETRAKQARFHRSI